MLTKQNIESLKQTLEQSLLIIRDMQREKQYQALFSSEKDYRDSKEICKICPDDYFKFRCFDNELCLKINHRLHRYYVHFDCISIKFPINEFRKTFQSDFDIRYYNKVQDSNINFVFIEQYAFEECVNVFYKCCMFLLKHLIHSDKLFEIY